MTTCTAARHGTGRAYRNAKCRCPEVVEAMRAQWRRRNRRRQTTPRVGKPPPSGRRGYITDPDEYDHAAVLRTILGDKTLRLAPAERAEVAARLTARGWTAREIAAHVGCTERTVVRWRALAARATGRAA